MDGHGLRASSLNLFDVGRCDLAVVLVALKPLAGWLRQHSNDWVGCDVEGGSLL